MAKGKDQMKIEYVALDDVVPATRNPKEHDIGAIVLSLRRFGFVAPAIMNEATGRIVVGHGRSEALATMRDGGEEPPDRVKVVDGVWKLPVLRGITFKTDEEAEAYLVADNRLTEIGGWDTSELFEVLKDLQASSDLDGIGYDEDDLQGLSDFFEAFENVTFKEIDESVADSVIIIRCPECGHEFPK